MPSDDVILNLKQIAGYPASPSTGPFDTVVIQQNGLGGPYASISSPAFVGTALAQGGDMTIAGKLGVNAVQGGSLQFSNGSFGFLQAQRTNFVELNARWGNIDGVPIATTNYVDNLRAASVVTFNGRVGDVTLNWMDILYAGGAPIHSPRFSGEPRAPTPWPWSNSTKLATTAWVVRHTVTSLDNLLTDHPFVFTFNGRSGDVVLTAADLAQVEGLLDSPALTGNPTAPTPLPDNNSTSIATTEYVTNAVTTAVDGLSTVYAPIDSPGFVGYATAPTPPSGTSTGQIATTSFVMQAVADSVSGVATWNGRSGNVILETADIVGADGAPINSPVFTGTPQAPTVALGDNSDKIATTAWVLNEIAGSNIGVMSFNGRNGVVTLNTSDITGAGGAPIVSPTFSGTPMAPTAATNTQTDQIATCAFVMSAINTMGVSSFNGRTGAVTLSPQDVSAAGGLANPSPTLTGIPTAPTPAPGLSTSQIATTAFVSAAIIAAGGVSSFNGRSGVVTLTPADVNGAGGPYATVAQLNTDLAGYLPLTGGSLSGALSAQASFTVTATGAVTPVVVLNKTVSGQGAYLYGMTNQNPRWVMALGSTDAETGGNAGSNFQLIRYGDGGGYLDISMQIFRASGVITFGPRGGNAINAGEGMSWGGQGGNGFIICTTLAAGQCLSVNRVAGNGTVQAMYQNNIACGSITVANNNATAFNTSSDVRLKEDERSFDAGPYLDGINVYDFRFRASSGGGPRRHGVMAQEVAPVYPEAVYHNDATDWWGVDYSKFVPLLLQEVKSLRARVAQLEAA